MSWMSLRPIVTLCRVMISAGRRLDYHTRIVTGFVQWKGVSGTAELSGITLPSAANPALRSIAYMP
jgi:hypothetical protein